MAVIIILTIIFFLVKASFLILQFESTGDYKKLVLNYKGTGMYIAAVNLGFGFIYRTSADQLLSDRDRRWGWLVGEVPPGGDALPRGVHLPLLLLRPFLQGPQRAQLPRVTDAPQP